MRASRGVGVGDSTMRYVLRSSCRVVHGDLRWSSMKRATRYTDPLSAVLNMNELCWPSFVLLKRKCSARALSTKLIHHPLQNLLRRTSCIPSLVLFLRLRNLSPGGHNIFLQLSNVGILQRQDQVLLSLVGIEPPNELLFSFPRTPPTDVGCAPRAAESSPGARGWLHLLSLPLRSAVPEAQRIAASERPSPAPTRGSSSETRDPWCREDCVDAFSRQSARQVVSSGPCSRIVNNTIYRVSDEARDWYRKCGQRRLLKGRVQFVDQKCK